MKRTLPLVASICLAFCGWALAQPVEDRTPLRALDDVRYDLESLIDESGDRELADKAEDVLSKLDDAADKISKEHPDSQAAAGSLEGAIGDLESAVKERLLDPEAGIALQDDLVGISRALATRALNAVRTYGGKREDIRQARAHLSQGDALRASGRRGAIGAFKRAAGRYKDALAKAESALG